QQHKFIQQKHGHILANVTQSQVSARNSDHRTLSTIMRIIWKMEQSQACIPGAIEEVTLAYNIEAEEIANGIKSNRPDKIKGVMSGNTLNRPAQASQSLYPL
ncbi:30389_t:CDS:2, partial [Racocetra persica]